MALANLLTVGDRDSALYDLDGPQIGDRRPDREIVTEHRHVTRSRIECEECAGFCKRADLVVRARRIRNRNR